MSVRPVAAVLLTLALAGSAAQALAAGPTAPDAAPSAAQGPGGGIGWDGPAALSIGWDTPSTRSIGWDGPSADAAVGQV
ncbi:hypothetical protein ACFVUY_09140 [Kitasatospora sp. NPDC058063]|uniref:hypothetical protein n=1 Tax=unclassified Kitasatospora TaxID=2633591 RepID=UPI0036D9B1B7